MLKLVFASEAVPIAPQNCFPRDWSDQHAERFFLLYETKSLRERGKSYIKMPIDHEKTVRIVWTRNYHFELLRILLG